MSEFDAPRDVFALTDVERIDMLTKALEAEKANSELLATRLRDANMVITDMTDSRLDTLWERAAEIADDRGYCDVFDTILSDLGSTYSRNVEVCVTVEQTTTYDVHVTVSRNDYLNGNIETYVRAELGERYNTPSDDYASETGDWEITDWQEAE